jgi:hypothetical protein
MNEAEIQLHAMVAAFRDAIVGKDAPLAALFARDADFVNIAAMPGAVATRLPRTCDKG